MASPRALYINFKNDLGELLEVTDFSIATWLAFGASLQLISQSCLPSSLSYWLPLFYIIYRIARVYIDSSRIFTSTFTNVKFGGWTTTLPEQSEQSADAPSSAALTTTATTTSDGVVMFLLGARINQSVFERHLPRLCGPPTTYGFFFLKIEVVLAVCFIVLMCCFAVL